MDKAEIEARVRKVLAEQLAVDEAQVVPDARFAEDLNADSLDLVEAVLALEEEWSIDIPEEEMEGVKTVGQAVALVTGHHDPDSPDCTLDWDALARLPGLVFYMGVRHVAKIAARLSDSGMSPDTPAAVIESGTLPTQRVVVADLAGIGAELERHAVAGPAVLVVGEVVRFREQLLRLTACQETGVRA